MSKMKGAFITDLYSILRFRRKRSRLLEGSQNLLNSYLTDISFQTNTYSISVGAFSYGLSNLSVKAWGGGRKLYFDWPLLFYCGELYNYFGR